MPKDKKVAKKKLTLKEAKFTKEYLKTGNATQAAKNAGYSKNCAKEIGYENLTKPHIKAVVQSAAEKLGINPEYVLGNLKEIAEFNKKMICAPIVSAGQTVGMKEEMIDAQAAIKSTELLGKHLSLFTEKMEIKAEIENTSSEDQQINDAARSIAFLLAKSQSK